jgi:hypothetical protein
MITNADLISRLKNANKFLADDDIISDRYLYSLLKQKASVLIKREANLRKLLTSDNVYQNYECVDLILVNGTECDLNCPVRRTKNKLPKIEEGLYSYFIQGVFNTSNSVEIFPTTIRDYINHTQLRIKSPRKFYTIKDSYLYVLDPDVECINIYAYFTESIEDLDGTKCVSMYDKEFKIPSYLIDSLVEMCNQSLVNYHRLPIEQEDNNRDEQP